MSDLNHSWEVTALCNMNTRRAFSFTWEGEGGATLIWLYSSLEYILIPRQDAFAQRVNQSPQLFNRQ